MYYFYSFIFRLDEKMGNLSGKNIQTIKRIISCLLIYHKTYRDKKPAYLLFYYCCIIKLIVIWKIIPLQK
ncbi:hypothetical protein EFY79_05375 [Hanamia caeni]|uniref:Uncharacterized protein n=1 Tax=Hanamia caeni TaxID=2294116 RepID=A0A3M9NPW9_9BACT|nr:hypothetical protein EFY79_05375 [Hanamia caeni]